MKNPLKPWMGTAGAITWLVIAIVFFVHASLTMTPVELDAKGEPSPAPTKTQTCGYIMSNYTYACTPWEQAKQTVILLPFQIAATFIYPVLLVFRGYSLRLLAMVVFLTPYIAVPFYAFLYYFLSLPFRKRKSVVLVRSEGPSN